MEADSLIWLRFCFRRSASEGSSAGDRFRAQAGKIIRARAFPQTCTFVHLFALMITYREDWLVLHWLYKLLDPKRELSFVLQMRDLHVQSAVPQSGAI